MSEAQAREIVETILNTLHKQTVLSEYLEVTEDQLQECIDAVMALAGEW